MSDMMRFAETLRTASALENASLKSVTTSRLQVRHDTQSVVPSFVRRLSNESRHGQQETTQSDRYSCRESGPTSPHDAGHEPGTARRESRHHLPADTEVLERHQPDRREPLTGHC